MDDTGGNFADETTEMASETAVNAGTELRKRRSSRIVQAVPLVVTGVDALGRPFTERTSTLIINCHGSRYQSKHYVLKNMWVTLEIPHPEAGQPPRSVRGRVAWIQRPRTVRQLFQVALELEIPGNVWGIAFPPEDWFAFPDAAQNAAAAGANEQHDRPSATPETELHLPLVEPDASGASSSDNVRVFPSPTSTTDASLQLARHVTRLLADAKQQIQAAAREAASQAVSAERRLSFEQWEQKFAAARTEVANETSRAIEQIQQKTDEHVRTSHAAAAEALRTELPRWLAPQLEQLTRDLMAQLSQEGAAQRKENDQQLAGAVEHLKGLFLQAEEAGSRAGSQGQQVESQIAARVDAAVRAIDEAARQREEAATAQREALTNLTSDLQRQAEETAARTKAQLEQAEAQARERLEASARAAEELARQQEEAVGARREGLSAAASEIQQQVTAALSAAQGSWQERLAGEFEQALTRWRVAVTTAASEAQDHAAAALTEHARSVTGQLQEETFRQSAAMRDAIATGTREAEGRLAPIRDAVQEHAQKLEGTLARAADLADKLDQHSSRMEGTQQQALERFQSQLDDVLSLHRNELHRRSEGLFEEIHGRIRGAFDEASRNALAQFNAQIEAAVKPHMAQTEETLHRLAGGRSLIDAALTLQQDRIRNAADEAFAESLGRFRENLGGTEQLLQESSQNVTGRVLGELETRARELKHEAADDMQKSAEWYEKKAQTQIQSHTEKLIEQTANQLRDKAGEISSVFASELDHTSRNFVGHTHRQMEEVVRDSFERARQLFAEAADTTAAAFTDEIQRSARVELDGFNAELPRSVGEARAQLDSARAETTHRASLDQQEFLRRFQSSLGGALEAGVAEAQHRVEAGFGPLLESWKAITDEHQKELRESYAKMGEQATEQYRNRLENVSNQWMLATVASLDHQSRDVISSIASSAEAKLRETCGRVFAEIGDALHERLKEISQGSLPPEPPSLAKSANTGS